MWKCWIENSKIVSIRMLCSYLLILAAPLVAIIYFYMEVTGAMLDVQFEKSYRLITESTGTFEQQLNEVHNVSTYLLKNPDVIQFAKGYSTKQEELWRKYCFAQAQPDYSLTNQIIEYVYVMVKDSRFIVRIPAVVPSSNLGYQSVNQFDVDTYDELMERLCENRSFGDIILLENGNENVRMAMIHSMTGSGSGIPGVILITLNQNAVDRVLMGSNPDDSSFTFIMDKDSNILHMAMGKESDGGVAGELVEALGKEKEERNGYRLMTLGGEPYVVCTVYSQLQDWIYVTATPVYVLTERIGMIRVWMIVLVILALGISLLICLYYWSRQDAVLKQYYKLRTEITTGPKQTARPDLLSGIRDIYDYIKKLQVTLSLQENLVSASVLRKLLYGDYLYEEELIAELRHAGLEFPGKQCYVAVWAFDGVQNSGIFKDMSDFRSFIRKFLREQMPVTYYMYEVNYNTLAVIISDPKVEDLTEVRNLFISCNNRLRELALIDGYVGIAEPTVDLLKLSQCYDKARDACEYVRYYRMATPMSKDELPELSADQFMSPELERRLYNIIREGSEEDLCRVIQEIEKIMDERRPGLSMVRHYMNYIRSAAIRTLSEYCVEESILIRVGQIGEAETWNDLFRLIAEAKRLIKRITEKQSGADPDPMREELMALLHEKYCDQDFNLAAVAEKYGVSESKMYKDFRLYFGKSFAEILEEVRMEQACKLLEQGVPVKEVTVRTGYGSDTSFRRAFKRIMGVSPTDYCQCVKETNTCS